MTIKMLKNRWNTLKSQVENNSIELNDAKEKAIELLATAIDMVESNNNADDQFVLETLIQVITEFVDNTTEVSASL